MNKCIERLYNGIIKENPTFVLMLGMCPTLAVTTTAINGIGMGLSTTAVLVFSNLIISALRKIIPDRVRIPAYIVIVASLVTIVQLLLQAFIADKTGRVFHGGNQRPFRVVLWWLSLTGANVYLFHLADLSLLQGRKRLRFFR